MEWEPYADLTSIMGQKETKDASNTRGFVTQMFQPLDCCVVNHDHGSDQKCKQGWHSVTGAINFMEV